MGLSAKLLVLTLSFVMIAEVLIYVPSVANFRLNWLSDRLSAAYTLERFDHNGWVIVRQTPANHFEPNQIVLKA